MREYLKFYIDGQWVDPVEPKTADVINPATEAVAGRISLGSPADIDKAVAAARRAFASWSQSTRAERLDLLLAIQAEYAKRQDELGVAIREEMGAPVGLANGFHVGLGAGHAPPRLPGGRRDPARSRADNRCPGSTLCRWGTPGGKPQTYPLPPVHLRHFGEYQSL